MTNPQNVLVLMSDEHSRKILGCNGNPWVKTPNLDALAARGINFRNAYCNSPVCVPARAAFATGQYLNRMGYWDNADPYDGEVTSWHHRLRQAGHQVISIGKLHFRSEADDYGFTESKVPMHVIDGKGDLMGLIREGLPRRGGAWKMAQLAGPGESSYTTYDRNITTLAQTWLHEEAPKHRNKYQDKPWVLFVSMVVPHFPLTAPSEHFYRYYNDETLPWPKLYDQTQRPDHPFLSDYRGSFVYDEFFKSTDCIRRAVAGYYGLVSFLDENLGKVLQALEDTGLSQHTRVIYTSDHGDNLGARGLWGKSTFYEESAGVPAIMAGPGVPKGEIVETPVTHVDFYYQTILHVAGVELNESDKKLPGISLDVIAEAQDSHRIAFCEYHAMGSTTGAFMVSDARYKYVFYIGYPVQFFDLGAEPDPINAELIKYFHSRLEEICDPYAVNARAKIRQAQQLDANGGREKVIERGDLGFSTPPGVRVDFN